MPNASHKMLRFVPSRTMAGAGPSQQANVGKQTQSSQCACASLPTTQGHGVN